MPLYLDWQQIAVRLVLACAASFIIGFNRDEHGHPAGIRTTMLVCLAATFAMLQVNLLLPMAGKTPSSFAVMDLMRLPLGILSGIGFIGAGVIIKRGANVTGVTTAATIWFVTVLGLLFGGGNIYLGIVASLVAFAILWVLKLMEKHLSREYRGSLHLTLAPDSPGESELRQRLLVGNLAIAHWTARYDPPNTLTSLDCELRWTERGSRVHHVPDPVEQVRRLPGVRTLVWEQ
ncbi:MAG TPA: MgtC/SapB family protein [Bryobacteraceae bacterium]|nr:MgtC/SapB family protein [Bryobacteraceae bacterium]